MKASESSSSESLYGALTPIVCGMVVGATFLTRSPSSLPPEYTPSLYYGFFALATFIPIVLGIKRTWQELSIPSRKTIFISLFLMQCFIVGLGWICQFLIPSYQLIKALVIVVSALLGMRLIVQHQTKSPDTF